MTIALLVAGTIWLCRLYKGDADRTRLLCAVSMGVGFVLLNLPAARPLIRSIGGPLITFARLAGWILGPFVLLAVAAWALRRLSRRCWLQYPERSTLGRGGALLGSIALGLVVAILLRSTPLIAELAEVAEHASGKGLRAGLEAALDRLALLMGGGGARVEAP